MMGHQYLSTKKKLNQMARNGHPWLQSGPWRTGWNFDSQQFTMPDDEPTSREVNRPTPSSTTVHGAVCPDNLHAAFAYNQMFCAPQILPFSAGTNLSRQAAAVVGEETAKVRRRRPMRKTKQRPLFSPHQVQTMEKEFDANKYLTEGKRAELSQELRLTETQVKTWFQNRRTKWRKELRNEDPPRKVPDGRWKHSILAKTYNEIGSLSNPVKWST